MIRHFIAAAFFAGAMALSPPAGEAGEPAQLMAGDPSGPHVAFWFSAKHGAKGLHIETHQVGNPAASYPSGSTTTGSGCSRASSRQTTASLATTARDAGSSLPERAPTIRAFLAAFTRGRTAHVEVQNAAVMQMSKDISLIGFTRKLRSGS